ncbi:cystathionine beta-synthase, partial [Tulasnella sp. 403]
DRVAKRMVEEAEKDGRLIPGQSVVIEPTSGNTGIGLALVCAIKGYPVIITLPEKMSLEKEVTLRALGAEIVRTPTEAPSHSPESNLGVAKRLEKTIPGGIILNQYENPNNPLAHEYTTAPEIIHAVTNTPSTEERPSSGKVDVLVAGAGTGGTISGLSKAIKTTHNADCVVVGVDPVGSILAGPSKADIGGYLVEGIGYDFVPSVLSYTYIDTWSKTTDDDAFGTARDIIRQEGLLVGGSSGSIVAGALKYLKSPEGWEKFGSVEGKNVVVILPDSIRNYMSKPWFVDGVRPSEPTKLWKQIQEGIEKTKTTPSSTNHDAAPEVPVKLVNGTQSSESVKNVVESLSNGVNGLKDITHGAGSVRILAPATNMLISDPDYLIHTLRLTYLRNLDDPFGPRIITLNPQYATNPYIRAAGLADSETWPEINMPSSPQPTVDDAFDPQSFTMPSFGLDAGHSNVGVAGPGPSSRNYSAAANTNNRNMVQAPSVEPGMYPGATGLKYTTTIVGPGRSMGMGMRVNGRRSSAARAQRDSANAGSVTNTIDSTLQRIRSDSAPTPVSNRGTPTIEVQEASRLNSAVGSPVDQSAMMHPGRRRSSGASTFLQNASPAVKDVHDQTPQQQQLAPNGTQANGSTGEGQEGGRPALPPIALRFARNAEMEARRRERLKARFDGAAARAQAGAISPSRRQEEVPRFEQQAVQQAVNESAIAESDDDDDEPVGVDREAEDQAAADGDESDDDESEGALVDEMDAEPTVDDDFEGDDFLSTISPPERVNPRASGASAYTQDSSLPTRSDPVSATSTQGPDRYPPSSTQTNSAVIDTGRTPDPLFARLPIKKPPLKSSLTAMLSAKMSVSDNPFTTLYAAISGRAETASMTLRVYFPHSRTASRKPIDLKVRKDATVEEVIGFGLWTFWDQGLEPKLDEGLGGDDDPQRMIKLTAVGWNLRITEDDGEVDEDFPALDRTQSISKFSINDFAICSATTTQIEQNKVVEAKIVRRPSRLMISKKSRTDPSTGTTGNLAPPATGPGARTPSDTIPLMGVPAVSGTIVAQGPPVFLRVRVATTADMHYSTTINATSEEYMADVLDRVCRRRRIENSKEWALLTGDMRIVIPLDRTVASLAGKSDLVLVKKALLDQLGLSKDKRLAR